MIYVIFYLGDFVQLVLESAISLNDCDPDALCTNLIGSYDCECKEGFNGNGFNCTDIDECAQNIHNCHENATCHNAHGTYRPGFKFFRLCYIKVREVIIY